MAESVAAASAYGKLILSGGMGGVQGDADQRVDGLVDHEHNE